jgi:uncharacterized protein YdeI (YjbR/CyaY-like superfamily)
MNKENALYFKNRREWRRWLENNHDSAQEIWLLHYKKHSSQTFVSLAESVEEAICFGWIDGMLKSIDEESYMLRYSPRKADSVWSKINKDRAEKLIASGRMTSAGLARIEEAKKNGYWDAAYTNRTRDEVPSDLKEALMADPKALSNFEGFANSYRNMYVGWVIGAKTWETRRKRIAEVVRRSALNKKLGIE